VPVFKTQTAQSESETGGSYVSPEYIHCVLRRKESQYPTFGVYQDDTNGSFKIGRSNFKYDDKHDFIVVKIFKAMHGLWELLTV
jgi:hypothetical protein